MENNNNNNNNQNDKNANNKNNVGGMPCHNNLRRHTYIVIPQRNVRQTKLKYDYYKFFMLSLLQY